MNAQESERSAPFSVILMDFVFFLDKYLVVLEI